MKNILKITAIVALLVAVSCGQEKSEVADNRPIVNVKVSTPTLLNNSFISASGKLEAAQNANISTRIMGHVSNIFVKVGDKVSKGQLLAQISSADIQAQKSQAQAAIIEATAAFKNAEKDFERFKTLYSQQSASQKELDDITANYNMAKARLEAANQQKNMINAQLSYSNISAPFSGIITGKFINNGDLASPGTPLISIENPSKFEVVATVPESEITKIKKGTEVTVLLKSTNKIVKGIVTEVSSSAKNTGGQYLVKVAIAKTNVKLLSGMFTAVQFPIENVNTGVLIPQAALIKKGELTGVYTVSQSNTALLRWIRTGKTFGENIEVLSGLKNDEQFILSSESKLTNGAKLQIQ